jgi:hypothetical protein
MARVVAQVPDQEATQAAVAEPEEERRSQFHLQ